MKVRLANEETYYWARVRQVKDALPEIVHITSMEPSKWARIQFGRGGVVYETDAESAAQRIVAETHRLSTKAEIRSYRADQSRRAKESRAAETARELREYANLTPAGFAALKAAERRVVADRIAARRAAPALPLNNLARLPASDAAPIDEQPPVARRLGVERGRAAIADGLRRLAKWILCGASDISPAVKLEDIKPGMTAETRARAVKQISEAASWPSAAIPGEGVS